MHELGGVGGGGGCCNVVAFFKNIGQIFLQICDNLKNGQNSFLKMVLFLSKCLTNFDGGRRIAFKRPYTLGDMIRGQCFLLGERSGVQSG
jgi:hypothetical protein